MTPHEFYWKFWEQPKRRVSGFIERKIMGWDNATIIQREVNQHRNELVYFVPHLVVRLLGWTDQYDDDYYWVVANGFDIQLFSCVGGFTWLKGRLSKYEYYHADHIYEINHPIEHILKEIKEGDINLK